MHEAVDKDMLKGLSSGDYAGFVKVGMEYADVAINANDDADQQIKAICDEISKDKTVNTLALSEESLDAYYDIYTDLIK